MANALPQKPQEPAKLLVVDDEEIVLVALRDLLRQQGYAVFTAKDAVHALGLLKAHAFAAVIADERMPQLSGLEFLAEVKRAQPECSRLLVSGALDGSTVMDGINKVELFRFVLKPWDRHDLLRAVADAVQHHRDIMDQREQLRAALARNRELASRLEDLERQRTAK